MRKIGLRKEVLVVSLMCFFLCLNVSITLALNERIVMWVDSGGAFGVWDDIDPGKIFPVEKIVKDLYEIGTTDIYFAEQAYGYFGHPTKVKHAYSLPLMEGRDFLKELLLEAAKYNMDVWLIWTPDDRWRWSEDIKENHNALCPRGLQGEVLSGYDGYNFYDLNSPVVKRFYCELIKEIGENYRTYKNLKGIVWHEVNCAEDCDSHGDDLDNFRKFCNETFGEEYRGNIMPKEDPADKWWKRYYLYRCHVMESFIKEMADQSKKYNLKTSFILYAPDASPGSSWKWGVNPVKLEQICDLIDVCDKPYLCFKNVNSLLGLSYANMNVPLSYSSAFHGYSLIGWEFRAPLYVEEWRKAYLKTHPDSGNFYNTYLGHREEVVSLFFGKENLKNWLGLMKSWQGGQSASQIGIATDPFAWGLQYPSPGMKYFIKIEFIRQSISNYYDIDAFIMTADKMRRIENLKKYELIVIPENVPVGLDENLIQMYLQYIKTGGNLLVMGSPWLKNEGREDLTRLKDVTETICGLTVKGKRFVPNIAMESVPGTGIQLVDSNFPGDIKEIALKGATVLVKDKTTGLPLLCEHKIGKGRVLFSSLSFDETLKPYFVSLVGTIIKPSVVLASDGIKILETIKKGDVLCVTFWGKGKGVIKIGTKQLGLSAGDNLVIKNIVTGKLIGTTISGKELNGTFEIPYDNEPCILAVGDKVKLNKFEGIYSSEEVFKGLSIETVSEQPQVPISVPSGKGPRIGVYYDTLVTEDTIKGLKEKGMRVFCLPRIDEGSLSYCDVLILPQFTKPTIFNNNIGKIRKWVEKGGRVLLMHDAVGYREHKPIFPEIGEGLTNPWEPGNIEYKEVKVIEKHPVTEGIKDVFTHGYFDHVSIQKGSSGKVVIEDTLNAHPVVVTGNVGNGKVVLCGMAIGFKGVIGNGERVEIPSGEELKLLINSINWLSR